MRAAGDRSVVEPVTLQAGRWRLRPWLDPDLTDADTDRKALITAFDDVAMARFLSWQVRTPAEADGYLRRRAAEWRAGTRCSWAVIDGVEGVDSGDGVDLGDRVAGEVGLKMIDTAAGTARLAVWTHPRFRGLGAATAAVAAACGYGFGVRQLHCLGYTHAVTNTASARVAAASGFTLVGPELPGAPPDNPRADRLLWQRRSPATARRA